MGSYTIGNVKIKSKRLWYFDLHNNFQPELLGFVVNSSQFESIQVNSNTRQMFTKTGKQGGSEIAS